MTMSTSSADGLLSDLAARGVRVAWDEHSERLDAWPSHLLTAHDRAALTALRAPLRHILATRSQSAHVLGDEHTSDAASLPSTWREAFAQALAWGEHLGYPQVAQLFPSGTRDGWYFGLAQMPLSALQRLPVSLSASRDVPTREGSQATDDLPAPVRDVSVCTAGRVHHGFWQYHAGEQRFVCGRCFPGAFAGGRMGGAEDGRMDGAEGSPSSALPALTVPIPTRGSQPLGTPTPYATSPRFTASTWPLAWVDVGLGYGVTEAGQRVTFPPDAPLAAVLAALPGDVRRVYLLDSDLARLGGAGEGSQASRYLAWGLAATAGGSGWREDPVRGHWLDTTRPEGSIFRFVSDAGRQIDSASFRAWIGDAPCTPEDARTLVALLVQRLAHRFPGATLLGTPAATGQRLWERLAHRQGREYPPLPDDLQRLLRATSGQARVELFPPPDSAALLPPSTCYYDGRLMYAASMGGLGVGPVRRDTRDEYLPYQPARYHVHFTVPREWQHPGILPVQAGAGGWEWPAHPGETGESWAGDYEISLARWPFPASCPVCASGRRHGGTPCPAHGWPMTITDRLLFAAPHETRHSGPLDGWRDRLVAIEGEISADTALGPHIRHLVRRALRAVLLDTLGAFHRGPSRAVTRAATSGVDVPSGAHGLVTLPAQSGGSLYLWSEAAPLADQRPEDAAYVAARRHPEWSAQVWARCRGRMLLSKDGAGPDAPWSGMLALPPGSTLAVRTDGLFLTDDPGWPNDGRPGRLRCKGRLSSVGGVPSGWPRRWADLAAVKQAMEAVHETAEGSAA